MFNNYGFGPYGWWGYGWNCGCCRNWPYPGANPTSLNGTINRMSTLSCELTRGLMGIESAARRLRINLVQGAPGFGF